MDRKLAYFVSDVHLGLGVHDPKGREARFVSFLKSIPSQETEAVYLLGDIWDFWYEYKHVVPKGYIGVFAAIQDLISQGVKVFFFQGNHDVWAYSYFEELGMKKLEQPYRVELGGKIFCLGHGDGLGPVPFGYKCLRGLFHNRLAQILFSMLHPWFAFSFGNSWSKSNRLAHDLTYTFKGEDEPLYKFALDFSKSDKIDYFVFGHFHSPVRIALSTGAELNVLGDWISGDYFMRWDGVSLEAFSTKAY